MEWGASVLYLQVGFIDYRCADEKEIGTLSGTQSVRTNQAVTFKEKKKRKKESTWVATSKFLSASTTCTWAQAKAQDRFTKMLDC
jgi:hypothetical protein